MSDRYETGLSFEGVASRTKQAGKDDADINIMIAKFQKGMPMPSPTRQPMYGDFSTAGTYMQGVEMVQDVEEYFMALPAEVRSSFDNDPLKMFQYLEDEANHDEARERGLLPSPDGKATPSDNPPKPAGAGAEATEATGGETPPD